MKAPLTTAWVLNVGAGCWILGTKTDDVFEKFRARVGTDLELAIRRFRMLEAILVQDFWKKKSSSKFLRNGGIRSRSLERSSRM